MTEADVGSADYQRVMDQFAIFQKNIRLDYIYGAKKVGDKKYVFTVDPDPVDPAEFGEEVVFSPAMDKASEGVASVESFPTEDQWGKFYTAYSPIYNSDRKVVGIVGVDFDTQWYDDQMNSNRRIILAISLLSLFVGCIIVIAITDRIRRQFKDVNAELGDLSSDLEGLAREIGIGDGESVGEVFTLDPARHAGINYDDELSKLSAKILNIHKELKLYIDEARARAYIDGMTGVGNRTAYGDIAKEYDEQIKAGKANFALAIMDINGLKNINDNLGHEKGDIVIRDTAMLLKRSFGENDVYRLGGDEFIVIISGFTSDDMQEIFKEFDSSLDRFNTQEKNYEMEISVSKGFAVYIPGEDSDYRTVFKRADDAMYVNKEAYYQKNGYQRSH